eukprot:CAMPEP_0197624766 /NCGR_PEP_ID=MMETSP1338-20131121/4309_1 /TAXON_ID=43686 ORGANISM="Pelagodinium beii, Strain RCC1491" /NCGR_SAMPLE_ID=MMETSP1338 /ASSEMBLY_ACC=CAM_ASM_000754 /LENGTH=299 /DNA_ID=CAMNT_0043194979 /DNA_START=20 /DNA_END=916 /DNA_ORIENTATION=+
MADRLAALKARIKAKEAKNNKDLNNRLDVLRKEWDDSEAQENVQRKQAALKRQAEAAEEAAKKPKLQEPSAGMCKCGKPVVEKAVLKEGPNKGRSFFVCEAGKPQFGGCGYFKWSTETASEEAVALAVELPQCNCGKQTELRTAKKEGPNQGRSYFTCPQGKKEFGGCGFFEWVPKGAVLQSAEATGQVPEAPADEASAAPADVPAKAAPADPEISFSAADDDSDIDEAMLDAIKSAERRSQDVPISNKNCKCGSLAESRTVSKPGAHFGRPFLHCSKGKKDEGGCGFFEWSLGGPHFQ